MSVNLFNEDRERSNANNSSAPEGNNSSQQQGNTDDNSQRGANWNNYQTKELGGNEEGQLSAEEAAEAFEDE